MQLLQGTQVPTGDARDRQNCLQSGLLAFFEHIGQRADAVKGLVRCKASNTTETIIEPRAEELAGGSRDDDADVDGLAASRVRDVPDDRVVGLLHLLHAPTA